MAIFKATAVLIKVYGGPTKADTHTIFGQCHAAESILKPKAISIDGPIVCAGIKCNWNVYHWHFIWPKSMG